jgi:hypothetical protein
MLSFWSSSMTYCTHVQYAAASIGTLQLARFAVFGGLDRQGLRAGQWL